MRRSRISVIIPCRDTARYLGAAIESVLAQSPVPDEVLVVDDGSTDGSADIAERFGAPVRCDRQPHRGISLTRNRGLALATGDLIAFLDADDLWTPDSLAVRLACLTSDAAAGIATGLVEQFVSPELPDETQRTLLCPPGTQSGTVGGTMLVRREVFEQVGHFDPSFRIGETIDWVARARTHGVVVREVDRVVLRRRIHDANTGLTARPSRGDYLRVLKASIDRQRATTPAPPRP
jgi:glycosyltransferase involved in cell wall biosynthesis